jgi:hypothetical protein
MAYGTLSFNSFAIEAGLKNPIPLPNPCKVVYGLFKPKRLYGYSTDCKFDYFSSCLTWSSCDCVLTSTTSFFSSFSTASLKFTYLGATVPAFLRIPVDFDSFSPNDKVCIFCKLDCCL